MLLTREYNLEQRLWRENSRTLMNLSDSLLSKIQSIRGHSGLRATDGNKDTHLCLYADLVSEFGARCALFSFTYLNSLEYLSLKILVPRDVDESKIMHVVFPSSILSLKSYRLHSFSEAENLTIGWNSYGSPYPSLDCGNMFAQQFLRIVHSYQRGDTLYCYSGYPSYTNLMFSVVRPSSNTLTM